MGATNTLELASAASAGTVTGLGSNFRNFGTLTFDSGAQWSVEGGTAGLPGTITGFSVLDTITIDNFVAVSRNYIGGALVLTDGGGHQVSLGFAGNYWTSEFAVTGANAGTGTAIRLIGNLGNRATYEFSELDTAKILGALEEAITDVKKRMVAPEEKSETAFKL